MFGSHFYHATVRKSVAVFGTLFNNITVIRKDGSGGILNQVKVPLAYGPKQKFLARLNEDLDNQSLALKMPRMAFEITNIDIDLNQKQNKRNKITKDNLGFFEDIAKIISSTKRPLIIFPQATRVLPNERPPFKKGASRIYEKLKIPCQPVAINSGYVWPKKGPKSNHKTITISILKPIAAGLSKEEFINSLEKKIYEELDLLN